MSKYLFNILIGLCLFCFVSCGNTYKKINNNLSENLKIISLVPSITEILVGLSLEENIKGIDKHSQNIEGMDRNVQVFHTEIINFEEILRLNPDLLFVSNYNPSADFRFNDLRDFGIEVVNIETPKSIEEIYESILFIGRKTQRLEIAQEIVNDLGDKINKVKIEHENISSPVKIYFEVSPSPYLTSFGRKTFLDDIIKLAGGENIFKDLNGWISVSEENIIKSNPQIIFSNVNISGNLDAIKRRNGWENISSPTIGLLISISFSSITLYLSSLPEILFFIVM